MSAKNSLANSSMATISLTPAFLACLMISSPISVAGEPMQVLPSDERIEEIRTPADFFGFEIGSRHLRHAQVVDYFRYLAKTSDRVRLIPYGRTHGRRPLMVLAISSASNIEQIAEIRAARSASIGSADHSVAGESNAQDTGSEPTDQETRKSDAGERSATVDRIHRQLLVMYMGYSVHGDEASAVNAAPIVAYHLSSSTSESVEALLDSGVYLVDPALNPDGIDRFANWANENRGRFASPSNADREHNQPWPGGRTNYYWFDLNRDWLPAVHPESQGRLQLFHQWKPNVVLDFHEMGGSSTFFFQPGVPERNNPFSPPQNLELTRQFAVEHAKDMDAAEELFFTEERYDDFYVGKGSTYPDLHGAIGILFEQGSTRGLRLKNDRTNRHFRDTVANQVRTSLSSLRAAMQLKTQLLDFQKQFYADALAAGETSAVRAYILTGEASRLTAAAAMLCRHDIACYRPSQHVRIQGDLYPAREVIVIPTRQPEFIFIRSLMEPLQSFEQNIFYDVSTWHLPSAFDLSYVAFESDIPEAWMAERLTACQLESSAAAPTIAGEEEQSESDPQGGQLGYAFAPFHLDAPALVASAMRAGADVRVATQPFEAASTVGPTAFSRGSYLILKQPNQERWDQIQSALQAAASELGIPLRSLTSSLTAEGPDLGSSGLLRLPICRPMLVVGSGTSRYSAGSLWHFLDTRMRQPTTLVDTSDFGNTTLDQFTCIILPSGNYSSWGESEKSRLETYVRNGGTVIATASSINWLSRRGLISLNSNDEVPVETTNPENAKSRLPRFSEARDQRALQSIAGAFLMSQIDATHPLAFGFPDNSVPLFRDHAYRFPAPTNPYQLAASYQKAIAGYVSDRNRQRLAGTAAVWAVPSAAGNYILLADEPVFRGYVRASERFLTNAILLGPELDIPPPPR